MDYLYCRSVLPRDEELLARVNAAAERLGRRIAATDLSSADISDYNKRYHGWMRGDLRTSLQRYAYLLAWSLAGSAKPPGDFVFVDYGGGAGWLALLAKEFGVGTVIYNDIYDVSCRDARTIGRLLEAEAEHYVEGGMAEFATFLKDRRLGCDAVASFDVIEHVYDIEGLFAGLAELSAPPFSLVMASTANPYNPRMRWRMRRHHRQIEYHDQPKQWGDKARDCYRAYYQVRREIIAAKAPELSPKQVEELARLTRGLMECDIVRHV
jgi:SAM-dependent methyltransferase